MNCLFFVIMIITLNDFLNMYFGKRYKSNVNLMKYFYLGYFMWGWVFYIFHTPPLINMIISFAFLLSITFFFRASLKNRIFISICIFSLKLCFEIIIPYVFTLFFNEPIELLLEDKVISLYMMAMISFIPFIAVKSYIIYSNKRGSHVEKENSLLFRDWSILLIVPFSSILLMYFLASISLESESIPSPSIIIIIFIVIVINISFYYIYNRTLEMTQLRVDMLLEDKQIEKYNLQYEELKKKLHENKIIKHDLKHNLVHILSRCNINKSVVINAENEIDEMLTGIFKGDFIYYSNHSSLDMILNYQVNKAKDSDITIKVQINISDTILIDGKTICVILGNGLDNAIENCKQQEDKTIKLSMRLQWNNLYIDISNSYIGVTELEKGLPKTKKEDKQLHGLGLKSIQKVVEENGGHLHITTANNTFCLQILLNNIKIQERI